jgi:hypothetical protein
MLKLDGMTRTLSDEHDYSFECNKDVITMGNIQGDKTVSFLVPHSDASAFTAMVRLLSYKAEMKIVIILVRKSIWKWNIKR